MASPNLKRAIIGVLLITVGTLFLLDNLGYDIDVPYYLFSWPAIFLVIGLINVVSGKIRAGVLFFGLSAIFYLHYYDIINLRDIWPVILIILGIVFLFKRKAKEPKAIEHESGDMDEVAVFGGIDKRVVTQDFKGGKITSIFGGTKIDFRGSKANNSAVIDVSCVLGGVELTFPSDWAVQIDATAILGGFSDARTNIPENPSATVYIKGFTLLGGGEIKN